MKVYSVSHTIIGETRFAGVPCVLVRLCGCNLDCAWCDTPYARYTDCGNDIALDALISKISSENRAGWVLVTGGEPLMQDETPELLDDFIKHGYPVLLETNGSLPIDIIPAGVHIALDMKPPSSGMDEHNDVKNLSLLTEKDELKLPIADRNDFDWAMALLKRYTPHKRTTVSLTPIWDSLSPTLLAQWILDSGLPLRLNLQIHKIIGVE